MSKENTKKRLVLAFLGMDDWNRPVYKDETGRIFKDINCDDYPLELCTVVGGFDGEADTPIRLIERYKDVEIVVTGRDNEPTKEEKFNYMMLARLKSDCEYFIGYGGRNAKNLWAGNVPDQIEEMKRLHDSFSSDKKPEWLSYDEILKYETSMSESL